MLALVKSNCWLLPCTLRGKGGCDPCIFPVLSTFFCSSFAFTEGHTGKLQVWCRLSALPSGQQAKICPGGNCSVDQVWASDCCGCRGGERLHHCLLGEQPGGSLQGGIVFSLVDPLGLTLLCFYLWKRGNSTVLTLCPGTSNRWAIWVQQNSWQHRGREGQQEPFLWPQSQPSLHYHRKKGMYVRYPLVAYL